MDRALLALDRGWEPQSIVVQTMFSDTARTGEQSDVLQGEIDAFASLRRRTVQPDFERRERIIVAGIARFERMRDEAAARERRERVFGWEDG